MRLSLNGYMPLNAFVDVGTVDLAHALDQLLELGGSDLLISCGSAPRIRRDGVLRPMDETMAPLTVADTHRLIHEALSESQFAELATNRSVDFAFTWRETVRVRGNAYYQRGSLAAAFRLLPMRIPSFHELGIPQSVIDLIGRRQGLVLVTGPTGSGKSTTLAALVDHINHSRECHVVTIEDPIEYVHRHITAVVDQRQVGTDTGSFADALRSVFREDPDVILIGEMRDLETISSALTLAETGHLVLATLHTNDASQAIDRVLDGFEASQQQQVRIQLGACLTGIVYQQLLPAVGGGRIAAFEVLVANSAIRALIKEGKTNQIRNALQTSLRDGSQTLERSLTQLIKSGLVTDHEARGRSLHAQEIG